MSEKRTLQKERTREAIITAAMKVYAEQGLSAPTSAIAIEANISHGSIFLHFPTVDNLLVSILDFFSREMTTELHALSEANTDIQTLLAMHIDVLIRHESFYKRLIAEATRLPYEARSQLIAIQSTLSIHFSQALKNQIGAGTIKPVPFHILFNTWLGLIHYYLLNSDLFAPGESVLKTHKDMLIECFVTLIENHYT